MQAKPNAAPAANIAGMRRTRGPARPSSGGGPRAAGLIEGAPNATTFAHYQDEGQGLQVSPATVLTMSLIFIGIVISLHILGRFIA